MTEAHAEHRNTPYASLRAASNADAAKARVDLPTSAAASEPDYFTAEADRLDSFKQALYAAFLAAPKSGIPTALVDLTPIANDAPGFERHAYPLSSGAIGCCVSSTKELDHDRHTAGRSVA